jgi:deazaflavin-dependent oxidoreductase (nitroreductase family)
VPDDWNSKIIEEFRANDGKVGGPFDGATLLLLHTTGARSGQERVNPVMYRELGNGSYAVFASKGGAPTHPDWYHNLVANPRVRATSGSRSGSRTRRRTRASPTTSGTPPGRFRWSSWTQSAKAGHAGVTTSTAIFRLVLPW